mgnify:CR=1 FL=1|jgi:hypothetical protein
MAKEDLLFILKKLLQTDAYLEFLIQLDEADLKPALGTGWIGESSNRHVVERGYLSLF